MLHNVVKKLPAGHIFHDEENIVRGLDHLVQSNDVRMSEQFQNFDLSLDLPVHFRALDLLSIENFDCHLVSRSLMFCHCVRTRMYVYRTCERKRKRRTK